VGLEELDSDAVKQFLTKTGQAETLSEISTERLLRSWRLTSGNNPTVAGLILFGRNPQHHLPFAQINAARIPGTNISNDPVDRKDLTGRLLDVIDQAMRFLLIHLVVPHRIRGLESERLSKNGQPKWLKKP
jgi:ATP-dependent DNA helicase RecG